jgi:DNA-binding SARP family transcriptional activator
MMGDWAEHLRLDLEHRFSRAMVGLCEFYVSRRDYDAALATAERWLAADPLEERAARVAFECELALHGIRAADGRYRSFEARTTLHGTRPSPAFDRRRREAFSALLQPV